MDWTVLVLHHVESAINSEDFSKMTEAGQFLILVQRVHYMSVKSLLVKYLQNW